MSATRDSYVAWPNDASIGSHGFVSSSTRPSMPAVPRDTVSATSNMPLRLVYTPDSSMIAKFTGLPSLDFADDVTGSIRPPFGRRMKPSRTFMRSSRRPLRIIVCNGRYTFAVCSSVVASS